MRRDEEAGAASQAASGLASRLAALPAHAFILISTEDERRWRRCSSASTAAAAWLNVLLFFAFVFLQKGSRRSSYDNNG